MYSARRYSICGSTASRRSTSAGEDVPAIVARPGVAGTMFGAVADGGGVDGGGAIRAGSVEAETSAGVTGDFTATGAVRGRSTSRTGGLSTAAAALASVFVSTADSAGPAASGRILTSGRTTTPASSRACTASETSSARDSAGDGRISAPPCCLATTADIPSPRKLPPCGGRPPRNLGAALRCLARKMRWNRRGGLLR